MQFTLVQVLLAASLVAASPIPDSVDAPVAISAFGCKVRASACRIQVKASRCSAKWKTQITKCMPIQCIQDDLTACKLENQQPTTVTVKRDDPTQEDSNSCKLHANSCKYAITADKCTDDWKQQVLACMPLWCVSGELVQCDDETQQNPPALVKKDDDPTQEDSKSCQIHASACKVQIKAGECTAEWKKQVLGCMPLWCVSGALVECDSQNQQAASVPAPVQKDDDPTQEDSKSCQVHASACKFQITGDKCSAEWKKQVLSCMPLWCVSGALVDCDTQNQQTNPTGQQ